MFKDLIISSLLSVFYVVSVVALTLLTFNTFNTCVDSSTVGVFLYLLFGFIYAFLSYNLYYEPLLDTI